ncbi:hypothetical protein ACH5RR_037888 [Cinchona calisaya]|uniref:Uncharacterized protein n=1 Tax=Cinchona calisaya TaxID=153742 RepID=A0ABD2YB69_9GENT
MPSSHLKNLRHRRRSGKIRLLHRRPPSETVRKPFADIGGGIGSFCLLLITESARLLSEEISAILRGDLDYDLDSLHDSPNDGDESFSNVLHGPWTLCSSNNKISMVGKKYHGSGSRNGSLIVVRKIVSIG